MATLGASTLRSWRKKALAPLFLVAANAGGVAFTPERVRFVVAAAAFSSLLTLALIYARLVARDDRARFVLLPAAPGGAVGTTPQPPRRLSHRAYDLEQLRQLAGSCALAAGTAWCVHAAGLSSTWLLLQSLLLPLALFDSELAALHCWRLEETRAELQRPWPGEAVKAEAALRELQLMFR